MSASCIVGSKATPVASIRSKPYVPERVLQLGGDRGERAIDDVAVLARGINVIQDRKQRVQHADDCHLPGNCPVALNALAVVDVLGLQAKKVVLQLRSFGCAGALGHGLLGRNLNTVEDVLRLGQRVPGTGVLLLVRVPGLTSSGQPCGCRG